MADGHGASGLAHAEIRAVGLAQAHTTPSAAILVITGATNYEPRPGGELTPDKANNRININVAGLYRIYARIKATWNAAATQTLEIAKNVSGGSTRVSFSPAASSSVLTATGDTASDLSCETVQYLDVGERIALYATASAGDWTLNEVHLSVTAVG